jgi:membrane-associated HD superfamily phosphohydrolase
VYTPTHVHAQTHSLKYSRKYTHISIGAAALLKNYVFQHVEFEFSPWLMKKTFMFGCLTCIACSARESFKMGKKRVSQACYLAASLSISLRSFYLVLFSEILFLLPGLCLLPLYSCLCPLALFLWFTMCMCKPRACAARACAHKHVQENA